MTFNNLSEGMQNIVLYNYDFRMKVLFLFIFFFTSMFYLFYYKPNIEEKTPFFSVMVLRIFMTSFSFFGIALFPFILLTLNPTYSFSDFFSIYGIIYLSVFTIFILIISLDFIRWGFVIILKVSGLDKNSDSYYKFKKWYKTYLQK
jgi:hypothetical protein